MPRGTFPPAQHDFWIVNVRVGSWLHLWPSSSTSYFALRAWIVEHRHAPIRIKAGMDSPLFYEDIHIGQVWISPRRTVTEADVVNFATMTGDFNPLHVDYDFAAKSHYRQPVAHGLLGLSWVAGLGSYFPNVNTVAFTALRDWEFVRPLFFGDTVFVETTCLEKTPAGRRSGKISWTRRLLNQSSQVVQQGTFETLVALESKVRRPNFQRHPSGLQDEKYPIEGGDSQN